MERCGDAQCSPNATKGLTLFSCEPRHQRPSSPPLSIPSRQKSKPLYRARGTHPQLNWRLPNSPQICKTIKPSRVPRTQEKKLLTFHFHESSWKAQTDAPNANGKSFTLKLHQSYKSYWGNKRGRTKKITPSSSNISKI